MSTTTTETDPRLMGMRCYLQSKWYPALPTDLAEPALEAIDRANAGEGDFEVTLPEVEIIPRNAFRNDDGVLVIEALEFVAALRLEHLLVEPCFECSGVGYPFDAADEEDVCQECGGEGMI